MTMTTAEPTARKRRRKPRTKTLNHRPPIVASQLKLNEIDLTPGKEHLICPDCRTWCPITGMGGTPKLVPHHTDRFNTPNPRRCTAGSNRKVAIDVSAGAYRTKLIEASGTVAGRRTNRVTRKPRTSTPPPVSRIATTASEPAPKLPMLLEKARTAVALHRACCSMCAGGGRCEEGGELERCLAEMEATSRLLLERRQRNEAQAERLQGRQRAAQWRQVEHTNRQQKQVRSPHTLAS
ncbi:hypothetical protein [Streptomyces palmae]|uniref:hypothetical protein n=1 Tax=Streptomyces palmae TaxID=1701085 RepID=UPI001ADF1575|nr:hypothetical protein [Streptomyces palmae]